MLAGRLEIEIAAEIARLRSDVAAARGVVETGARGMNDAIGKVQSAFATLGISLGAAAFIHLIKGSIDAADHLRDLSKSTDIAVETLAGLGIAAKQSGGDLDSIAASINKLAQNMGKDAEKFRALGITAKEPIEAFKQLADIFVATEDPMQRAAVMAAALGKSWAGAAPLLAEGGRAIGEMVQKGTELSGMTKEFADQADAFNDKLVLLTGTGGLLTRMIAPLLPLLNQLADNMLDAQQKAHSLDAGFSPLLETFKAVVVLGGNVSFVLKTIGKDLGATAAQLVAFAGGNFKEIFTIRAERIADAAKERAEFDKWEQSILDVGTATKKTADVIVAVDTKAAAARSNLNAAFLATAKAAKEAAKESDSAYISLIRSITEKTAAMERELAGMEKQTEAEKLALDTMLKIQDGTLKLTEAQKISLATKLELLLAGDKALKQNALQMELDKAELDIALKLAAETKKLGAEIQAVADAYTKRFQDANAVIDQIKFETTLIGKSNEERTKAIALRALETNGIQLSAEALKYFSDRLKAALNDQAAVANTDAMNAFIKAQTAVLANMEFETTLIGLTNAEREKAIALRVLETSKLDQQSVAYVNLSDKIKAAIDTRELRNTLIGLRDSLTDSFVRAFESGDIKGSIRGLIDWIKSQFAKLILRPLLEPIMGNISGMVLGLLGMGGAGTAGASGLGGMSAASSFSSLASLASGAYNFGSQALSWLSSGGSSVASMNAATGLSAVQAGGGGAVAGGMGALGAAAGYGALGAAAGYVLTPYLSADEDAAMHGAIGGGAGAVIGGFVGAGTAVGGPWGAVIGAIVGILVAAFSDADGPAMRLATVAAGRAVETFTYGMESELGTLGIVRGSDQWFSDSEMGETLNQWFQTLEDIDNAVAARLTDAQLIAARAAVGGGSTVFGFGTEHEDIDPAAFGRIAQNRYSQIFNAIDSAMGALITGFSGTTGDLLLLVDDLATVNYQLTTNGAALAQVFGQSITFADIQAFKTEGESYSETLQRIGSVFFATNPIALMFGKTQEEVWGTVGLASEAARQALIEAAGGLDIFTRNLSSYYSHYYSEEERLLHSQEQLTASFASLGLAMPSSLAAFRAIIESLDLTSESGRATYTALMAVEAQFYDFTTATEAAGGALEDATASAEAAAEALRERQSWQDELDILQGKTTQEQIYRARQWTEATDLATRALMEQVFAEQDLQAAAMQAAEAASVAAAAARETQSIQDRIDIASGARSARDVQRANEWADATSEADRAQLVYLYHLEDVNQAARDAAESLKTMHDQLLAFQSSRIGGATAEDIQFNADYALASVQVLVPSILSWTDVMNMSTEQFLSFNEAQRTAILGARDAYNALHDLHTVAAAVAYDFSSGYGVPIVPGAVDPAVAAAKLLDDQLALLAEIYKLNGNAVGAAWVLERQHAIALALLNPALHALQTQLWGLQAAAAAAAKAAELLHAQDNLRVQILRAQGQDEAATALERLMALADLREKWGDDADSMIELQQELWAALDVNKLKEATDNWTQTLRDWLNGNLLGDLSPLTAQQKLAEAQRQYNADLLLAQGGDQAARDRLTRDADTLLALDKAVEGFGGGYSALYMTIRDDFERLIGTSILDASRFGTGDPYQSPDWNPGTTASAGETAIVSNVVQLRTEVAELKEVQGRLMERLIEATTNQTGAIVGAVTGSGDKITTATTNAAVVNERY